MRRLQLHLTFLSSLFSRPKNSRIMSLRIWQYGVHYQMPSVWFSYFSADGVDATTSATTSTTTTSRMTTQSSTRTASTSTSPLSTTTTIMSSPLAATTHYHFIVQRWHGSGPDHGQFTGVVYPLNQDPAQDYALYVRWRTSVPHPRRTMRRGPARAPYLR